MRSSLLIYWTILPILAGALNVTGPFADAEEWGSISGQILVSGIPPQLALRANADGLCPARDVPDDSLVVNPANGGLSYAVVYLQQPPAQIHPELQIVPEGPVRQIVNDCRFTPHIVFARTRQPVDVVLSDPIPHHVRAMGLANQLVGGELVKPDLKRFVLTQSEKLPMRAVCDLHRYMEGWWLVLDHPYGAITDAEGKFKIRHLPACEHRFTIWHERCGYLEKSLQITVRPEEQELPPLTYPIEQFSATAR